MNDGPGCRHGGAGEINRQHRGQIHLLHLITAACRVTPVLAEAEDVASVRRGRLPHDGPEMPVVHKIVDIEVSGDVFYVLGVECS